MNGFDVLTRALERITSGDHCGIEAPRHASVCVLVAGAEQEPSICLIRRAKWEPDPWSEHIALPGGSRAGEETAAQTVRREVMEEVGVSIEERAELNPLPQLRIRLAGKERLLLLDSFVCRVTGDVPALQCGPEIHSAFWLPISELWDSRNLDCLVLSDRTDTLIYPAIRTAQGTIFGITLRVLTLLSDQLKSPLPCLEEIPLLRRTRTDRS